MKRAENNNIKKEFISDNSISREKYGNLLTQRFKNNDVDNSASQEGQTNGGAIALNGHGNVVIIGSSFEKNKLRGFGNGGGSYGGAIFISSNWSGRYQPLVFIIKSRFSKNVVDWFGGNTNTHGGALYAAAPFAMWNTVVDSNEAAFNSNNGNGSGMGGGIFLQVTDSQNNGSTVEGRHYLFNNTIVNNIASSQNGNGQGGGVNVNSNGNSDQKGVWFNNILYGNVNVTYGNSNNNNDDHNNFGAVQVSGGSGFKISNSNNNIEGALSQQFYSFGNNTYDISPGFIGPSNYNLSDASPMIGLGITSFEGITAPSADFLGNSRPNPVGSNPDLGAYENALATSPYPAQVLNLTGKPNSGEVTLSWDALEASNIEYYEVYMSTSPNVETSTENYVDQSTTTSLLVTGLQNNTEYHFKVAAVDSDGYRGSFSKELKVIPSYNGPNWWISNNGDDEFGDGSEENPFQSLVWPLRHIKGDGSSGDGLAFFNDGDTIRIMASNDDYHLSGAGFKASRNQGDQLAYIEVDGMSYNAQLTNFTIMGDSNDPSDARINGSPQGSFDLNGVKATFKNLTLKNSHNENGGGAINAFDAEIIVDNTFFRDNSSAVSKHGYKRPSFLSFSMFSLYRFVLSDWLNVLTQSIPNQAKFSLILFSKSLVDLV